MAAKNKTKPEATETEAVEPPKANEIPIGMNEADAIAKGLYKPEAKTEEVE